MSNSHKNIYEAHLILTKVLYGVGGIWNDKQNPALWTNRYDVSVNSRWVVGDTVTAKNNVIMNIMVHL